MMIQEFDYSINILESILWQYNDATNLLGLLNEKQDWINAYQEAFWTAWFNDVFALGFAKLTLFGAAVWSIILNIPLFVPQFPEDPNKPLWGFNAYDPSFPTLRNSYVNFTFGNFSNRGGQPPELTLAAQIFVLRLRYYDLTTRGDIIDINRFLDYLIATSPDLEYSGTIYCLEGYQMHMSYVFTERFPAALLEVLSYQGLDVLPRPAAVGERLVENVGPITFGFNRFEPAYPDLENGNVNFSHGNFFNGVFK